MIVKVVLQDLTPLLRYINDFRSALLSSICSENLASGKMNSDGAAIKIYTEGKE